MCSINGGGGKHLVQSIAVFFVHKRNTPFLRSISGFTKMKVNLTIYLSLQSLYYNYA